MSNEPYIIVQTRGEVFAKPFYSDKGKGVLKFKLLTKNHDDQKVHADCIAFGGAASKINEKIGKGYMIHIRGSFKTGSYTNQQGQKVGTHEIFLKSSEDVKVEAMPEIKQPENEIFGGSSQIDIADDDLPF